MQVTSALVVERLVAQRRCSQCGGRYGQEDIHVLARRGAWVWDLAAVCQSCSTLSLIRAVACRTAAADDAPVGSELTAAEARRFRSLPPIGRSDVVSATTFLAAFDGNFQALFEHRREGI